MALVLAVYDFVVVVMAWTSVPQIVVVGYSTGVNCLGPPIGGHLMTARALSSTGCATLPRIAGKAPTSDRFLGTYPGACCAGVKPAEAEIVVAGGVLVVVVTVPVVAVTVSVSVSCDIVSHNPYSRVLATRIIPSLWRLSSRLLCSLEWWSRVR